MMSKAWKPCLSVISAALFTWLNGAAAGTVDSLQTVEYKDGKQVATETTMSVTANVPMVVEATVPKAPTSAGFFFTPTGNGSAGRLYATANRAPSAVISNNGGGCSSLCCQTGNINVDADPIVTSSGTKVETYPLFALPGDMGLRFALYYNGGRWSNNLAYSLDTQCTDNQPDSGVCKSTFLHRPDGSVIRFSGGPQDASYKGGGVTTLTRNPTTGIYTLTDEDATTQTYTATGELQSITGVSGIGWTLTRSNGVTTVTHTNGQSFTVKDTTIAGSEAREEVTNPAGGVYTIVNPRAPTSITYPGEPATTIGFKYTSFPAPPYGAGLSEVDYNGVPHAYTTYDMAPLIPNTSFPNGHYRWATGTYLADGSERVTIDYGTDQSGNLRANVTNPLGHMVTKTFDKNGNITLITGTAVATCGSTVSGRTYDANGHLSAEIDNNGNTHAYTYAANGQLQSETEAYGTPIARTTDYVWDPNSSLNRLLSATVRGWKKTTYTYNAQNRLASESVTNLSGNGTTNETLTTTYQYSLYPNGMVQTMTVDKPVPSGSRTDTYAYDTRGNLVSVTTPLGQTTRYSNYHGLGSPGRIVGPNGDTTDLVYDARGRLTTRTSYPNGIAASWTYTYDGFGLLRTQSSPDGQVTTWTRDPSTMRVSSITRNDKDGDSVESFVYDANGDVLERKLSRGNTIGLLERYHYDALGRVQQKVGQNGQLLAYTYDGNGNVLTATDASGHRLSYTYDALDRVTSKTESDVPVPPAVPTAAPTLSAPGDSVDGNYAVTWTSVKNATSYPLQMQANGGGWSGLQATGDTSWSASSQPTGTYDYRVQACNVSGCGPWSNVASTKVANIDPAKNPIGINGKTYQSNYLVKSGSASAGISFDIYNGTWQVARISPGARTAIESGSLPGGAVSVQFTWIDAGVPSDIRDAKGTINNPAVTPVAVTGNPSTTYVTAPITSNQPDFGHQYNLRVDIFDAAGRLISTSTCLLIVQISGNV